MIDREILFDSLVRNGFEFLDRSISELGSDPKFSVIHFYTSIEILLKSRLLIEHWALVYDQPGKANQQNFLRGEFRSANYAESIARLKAIADSPIPRAADKSFRRLKDHRNKLVHFFHPEYGPEASPEVIAGVVAEECLAWLYLHRLLTGAWSDAYSEYAGELERINFAMMQLREFLSVRYDEMKDDIQNRKAQGVKFHECLSCGFRAATNTYEWEPIVETDCLVCEKEVRRLELDCPTCGAMIQVLELGEGTCSVCGTDVEMNDLISTFGADQTPLEALESPAHSYCPSCEWVAEASVVPRDDEYLCLNCFTIYDRIGTCGWCGELNAGDVSDTYLDGCVMCEGRVAWGD